MRADDEPSVPVEIHHWLEKLEHEVLALRTGQSDIIRDINDLRLAQAASGRMPPGMVIGIATIVVALGVQTAYGVYWGGGVTAKMDMIGARTDHVVAIVEEHMTDSGAVSSGVSRVLEDMRNCDRRVSALEQIAVRNQTKIDAIEQRNKVADQNWDVLKRKGLLVESTR